MLHSTEGNPEGHQIFALLRQYDEALAGGASTAPVDADISKLDPGASENLAQLCQCVALLEEVRREGGSQHAASLSLDQLRSALGPAVLPQQLGRFELRGEIGRGGCGVVLLAYDPQLNRDVAIKIPRPEALVSEDLRQRFLREARAAGTVDHQNIVPIYEIGEDGPISFIAAAYIRGPSLAKWLIGRQDQVNAQHAASLVATLAGALQHAHARGVIHRDVKPGNILLQPIGPPADGLDLDDYEPKITDFGLAKLREANSDATRTGAVIGTPLYMSPEQAEGRLDAVGPATDIYALGTILFELLTGHPPLRGESDVDTLRRIVCDDPPLVRIARPQVPRDLEAICQKCLEKNPSHRFASAGELADDLRRFLDGVPTSARPIGATRRAWRWARRRPAITALLLVTSLSLSLLVAGTGLYNARLAEALNATEVERNRAEIERNRAESETLVSRQLLYSAEVRLAYDAWRSRNRQRTLELLSRHIPQPGQPDLREFAWRWLWGQCHAEIRSFVGHSDEVFCVEFSPDGQLLATASKDGTARIWDAATGKVRHILRDHTTEVTCLAFSPDGAQLATGSEDRQIILWDSQTGESLFALAGHDGHLLTVAFSPDGSQLASGGRDNRVRLWDLSKRRLHRLLEQPLQCVRCIRYSPDGQVLAACDEAGVIYRWVTDGWKPLPPIVEADGSLFAIDFRADSRQLVAAGRDSVLYNWNLNEINHVAFGEPKNHESWVRDARIAPNGTTVATANQAGFVRLWDISKSGAHVGEALLATILGHTDRVWNLAWSPDGKQLATASADKTVKLWNVASHIDASSFEIVDGWISNLAFSDDSTTLVSCSHGGRVDRWDAESRRLVSTHPPLAAEPKRAGNTTTLAILADGSRAATSYGNDNRIRYLDLNSNEEVFACGVQEGRIYALDIARDGTVLAVASENSTATILELPTGRPRHVLQHASTVTGLMFSPDGRTLVTCSRELRLWNAATGALLWGRRQYEANPRSAAYSPDGRTIAAAVGNNIVVLADASNGQTRGLLQSEHGRAGSLAFSPDGKTLAVGATEKSIVTLWDVRTRQELCTLSAQLDNLNALAFSPDGRQLVAGGQALGEQHQPHGTGQIVEWEIPPGSPSRTAGD